MEVQSGGLSFHILQPVVYLPHPVIFSSHACWLDHISLLSLSGAVNWDIDCAHKLITCTSLAYLALAFQAYYFWLFHGFIRLESLERWWEWHVAKDLDMPAMPIWRGHNRHAWDACSKPPGRHLSFLNWFLMHPPHLSITTQSLQIHQLHRSHPCLDFMGDFSSCSGRTALIYTISQESKTFCKDLVITYYLSLQTTTFAEFTCLSKTEINGNINHWGKAERPVSIQKNYLKRY